MDRRRGPAIRELVRFSLLVVLAISTVGYSQQRDMPKSKAPLLVADSIQGDTLDLQKMADEGPVLLYFWATWCPYCRKTSPMVSKLAYRYKVIAIALQSGSDKQVLEYQRKHRLKFSTINDPDGGLSSYWGVRGTPTMVIVNSDGEVAWVTSGVTSKLGLQTGLQLTD